MAVEEHVLFYCGIFEVFMGTLLGFIMIISFISPTVILSNLFSVPSSFDGLVNENSWAQTAIAFGMHAYADFATGLEMMSLSTAYKIQHVPATVTVWNSTLFMIRFLWLLVLVQGMIHLHGIHFLKWPVLCLIFIGCLAIDAVLVRPAAVWAQRRFNDASPAPKGHEKKQWESMSFAQKCCRCVFYYEAVLSGCSGMAYFLIPMVFIKMYFPDHPLGQSVNVTNLFDMTSNNFVANWCLAQFGVNVAAFGLYQMSADIDTRRGHVIWWLLLDYVWMYLYWEGVTKVLGPWNPFSLHGANIMCHIAFHADSTLALARMVWLAIDFYNSPESWLPRSDRGPFPRMDSFDLYKRKKEKSELTESTLSRGRGRPRSLSRGGSSGRKKD